MKSAALKVRVPRVLFSEVMATGKGLGNGKDSKQG